MWITHNGYGLYYLRLLDVVILKGDCPIIQAVLGENGDLEKDFGAVPVHFPPLLYVMQMFTSRMDIFAVARDQEGKGCPDISLKVSVGTPVTVFLTWLTVWFSHKVGRFRCKVMCVADLMTAARNGLGGGSHVKTKRLHGQKAPAFTQNIAGGLNRSRNICIPSNVFAKQSDTLWLELYGGASDHRLRFEKDKQCVICAACTWMV